MAWRDLNYWIELLFRRKNAFLETAGIIFGLVALGTLLWPPVYKSTAEIFVQDNRAQLLVSPNLQTGSSQNPSIVANPVNEQDLNSEVELLTSIHLVKQAIAGIPLPHDPPSAALLHDTVGLVLQIPNSGYRMLHDSPPPDSRDQWALKLAHHLDVSVIKRSNIIAVSFRAHDSRWAHDFLSRLIGRYQEYHAGLSNDPEAAQFFNDQAKQLNARLTDSEEKLRQFQVQTGITSLPDQKQALVARLSDLQLQGAKNSSDLASAKEQVASLTQELKATPQQIAKETRSVQNLALQQIKPEVMQLEAERADLLSRYQPTSKRITEIDAKLAAAHRILNHENHLEVQEASTDLNPVWVTLDQGLKQAEANAASLKASHDVLNQQIEAMRQQLTNMVNNGLTIERLTRQVSTDSDAYLAYVRKGEEAHAAQGLNLNKILNISLAQAPTLPMMPSFPIIWLNLLAGAVLGVLAGIAAAFWEEQRDPRLYSTAAVEEASGVSAIAVLRNEA
ncbi:MAG: GumC family protein [Candidatus Binataceae bacterium]